MFVRVILSNFTQGIIFLRAIIANVLNLTRKLTLGFKSNLKNPPSLAEGVRGWVKSKNSSLRGDSQNHRSNPKSKSHCHYLSVVKYLKKVVNLEIFRYAQYDKKNEQSNEKI